MGLPDGRADRRPERRRGPARRSTAGAPSGKPLSAYTELKADGSTACGCWIYCGCYADGVNQTARRKPGSEQHWVAPEWGWAWPANRRLLYNRASADPDGRPWSERKKYVWWDEAKARVDGRRRSRLQEGPWRPTTSRRTGRPPRTRSSGDAPFIMQADGKGWLYVPNGLTDGPLPAHYEPHESPVANPLYGQQANPTRQIFDRRHNQSNPAGIERLPLRVHHLPADRAPHRGRHEPVPALPVRAAARVLLRGQPGAGRRAGPDQRRVGDDHHRPRPRSRPGCWSPSASRRCGSAAGPSTRSGCPTTGARAGLSTGDSANDLLPIVLDPNVHIQEAQGGDVRHPPGPAAAGRGPAADGGRPPEGGSPMTATTAPSPGWGSSPTRRSASAARRARWPARSGTTSPTTASTSSPRPTTTPAACRPTPGATSRSSSSPSRTAGSGG